MTSIRLSSRHCRPLIPGCAIGAAAVTLVTFLTSLPASAQQTQTSAPQNQSRTDTIANVLRRIALSTGANLVADSNVAQLRIVPPAEAATPQNLDKQLDAVVHALGAGATWAKLYLPARKSGRADYKGDAVADFAFAEAGLFGTIGSAMPPGMVEVLGERVSSDWAAGLNLQPVYLVTRLGSQSPAMTQNGTQPLEITAEEMQQLTPDQVRQLFQDNPYIRMTAKAPGVGTQVTEMRKLPGGGVEETIMETPDMVIGE